MARNHARLLTRIWNDDDFLDLSAGAQRLYMLLLSQQNLSHAGLLPMTVKRWANKAKDTKAEDVEAFLMELERAFYVVTDDRTEELLIRTLMRGDEVWKQINVTKAACKDARSIASDKLQRVMACEVGKMLALDGLPVDVTKELTRLGDALPNPSLSPPEPLDMPTPDPGGRGSVTEVTTDSPSPTPSTSPTPVPALCAEPPDDPTGQLLAEHANAYTEPPPPSALAPVKREIMRLVAEHVPPDRIRDGLTRLREKRLAASLLPQLVTETAAVTRPSTTDQAVAAGNALVRRYAEAGE